MRILRKGHSSDETGNQIKPGRNTNTDSVSIMLSWFNKCASVRSPIHLTSNHIARTIVSARQTTSVVSPLATLSSSGIRISWPEGGESHFHNIWLRDHCRCPRCLHQVNRRTYHFTDIEQVTRQRLFDTFSIPDTIKPSNIDWDDQGLRIRWGESDHESNFRWPWLRSNSFTSHAPQSIPSNKVSSTETKSLTFLSDSVGQ